MRLRAEVGTHSITLLVRLIGGFTYLWTLSILFGPEGNGVYALTLALSGYVGGFLALGLPLSIIRATAHDAQAGNRRFGQFLLALFATTAVFGILIAIPAIGQVIGVVGPLTWLAIVFGVLASGIVNWLLGVALGRGELRLIATSSSIEIVVRFLSLFSLSYFWHEPSVGAYAWIVSMLIHALVIGRSLRVQLRWSSFEPLRNQVADGFSALLTITLTALIRRADVPIVASVMGLRVAGWYGLAATISDVAVTAPSTLGQVLVARAAKRKDAGASTIALLKWSMLAALAIGALIFVLGPMIVGEVFGDAFANSGDVLRIMAVGVVFSSGSAIILNHFVGRGVCLRLNAMLGMVAALVVGMQYATAQSTAVEWIAVIGASAQIVVFAIFALELRADHRAASMELRTSSMTANDGSSEPMPD